jgi:cobalt-zinc-cadmium efflux system membrane fusion protein
MNHRITLKKISPPGVVWALGASALLALGACARKPLAPPPPPAPRVAGDRVIFPAGAPQLASLATEAAAPRKLAITHVTGRLYWNDDATVRIFTPVAGRVAAVRVDIGQPVTAGTPLAEISSPDFGQALADARTAAGNLAAAEKAFHRASDLLANDAAAQKDVEAAEAAFVAARAERDRARSRLALYGGTEDASAELFVLRSPLAGTVVEKTINPGQEVRADQMLANATNLFAPLFVVSDPRRLWLQLDVAETDLQSLREGLKLQIYSKAFPGKVFSGTIDRISPELDPTTRTVKVRGIADNPDLLLKAEMYVSVDVVQDESAVAGAGVEIPSKGIFTVDGQDYVFVEGAPGEFQRRKVVTGTEKDAKTPVFSGVAAGDRVVIEGALLLQAILDPAN